MKHISLNKEEVMALQKALNYTLSDKTELDGVELFHCRNILGRLTETQEFPFDSSNCLQFTK